MERDPALRQPGVSRAPVEKKQLAWLGLDSRNGRYLFGEKNPVQGMIEPAQVVQIVTRPLVVFRGERLFVARACAPSFLIRRVVVGNRICSAVNLEPLIAEPFAVDFDALATVTDAIFDGETILQINVDKKAIEFAGAPFPLPTVHPGLELLIDLEHIGETPQRFLGAFLGQGIW